ncbi:hypothetical protein I0C86_21320 [Plantactinospora sp. S1510]|uniref:Glycosyltransferase RgtA/B/C/D-like domain-containing protein n=1 Tax=Plantactinospora alkalitolerans TaxID=2789879 RepID=A0ABS0GZ32_9ACTN|nr:hypothetical protein [Plantactinospora alkalitolerans]MBF9131481.1 hypothetical protein [Plantactinospora alkalitolerans]
MTGTSPTTVELSAPVATSVPTAGRRIERWGWGAVGAITAVVASTWVPLLGEPFGDNHLGRIVGRYALHERNLQEQGILGSQFGADWAPYASAPYAHHPPLLNLLTGLTGLLPGDAEYQIWLPPYLLALLIIPAGAALLRGFGVRWSATLLAIGLMVATPFYWVYSPLMFDLGPILALSAAVVRLRTRPDPGRALVVGTCAAALSTTLVSWPGIAFAAALGLWLFLARRIDRVTVLVAASMLTGLAISLAFVVGVTGMDLLGGQAELRSTGGDYTVSQFLSRQWHFAYLLLPVWYLGALPLGAVAGLLDRRTRSYLAMAIGFTAAWVLGLSNGAYVHSYWSYPVLVVGLVGMGVLLDRIVDRLAEGIVGRRSVRLVAVALIWAALGTYLGAGLVVGPVRHRLLTEPTRAGRLVAEHPPAAGQRYAWIAGTSVTTPRWFVYYWQLAPRTLTVETLRTEPTARADDLVLMNVRQRPDWLPESIEAQAVARDGPYALVPVAALRTAARY